MKTPDTPARRKLGYKEKFELEKKREILKTLPARIERLEAELGAIQTRMSDAEYYKTPADTMAADQARFEAVELELENAYGSWEELEAALEGAQLD